jgi:hypothetical protein
LADLRSTLQWNDAFTAAKKLRLQHAEASVADDDYLFSLAEFSVSQDKNACPAFKVYAIFEYTSAALMLDGRPATQFPRDFENGTPISECKQFGEQRLGLECLLLSDDGEEWDYGQPVQSVGETRKFIVSRLDSEFVFLIPFPSEALAVESRVDIRSVSLRIHEKLSRLSVTGHPDWNYRDGDFYDSHGHAISRDAALSSYRGKDPIKFFFGYTFLSVRWPGLKHEVVDPKTPLKTICGDFTAISPCRTQFDGREIEDLATPIGSLDATKDIRIRRARKITVQFPERRTRESRDGLSVKMAKKCRSTCPSSCSSDSCNP